MPAEHSILLDRSQAGARRGRVLVTRQYIRFSFVIRKHGHSGNTDTGCPNVEGAFIRVLDMTCKQPLTCDAFMQQVLPALAFEE